MTHCTTPKIEFPSLKRRKVEAEFSGGEITSDGGALLLREADRQLGLMKAASDLYDLEQAANHTSKLTNNISFDLYKEGSDTNQDLIIDNGELRINENYSFNTIKIANTDHYTQGINISDAIDVLRHIVDLEKLTAGSVGYHAADVNNDGKINISDAIDILRHIVDLEAIDTFDLIDESGDRVSNIDATSLDNAPEWLMVANGDVNASGEFAESYVSQVEIV